MFDALFLISKMLFSFDLKFALFFLQRDQPMVDLSSDSQLFPFSSAQQNHRPVPESGRRIHLRNFNCAEMDQEMVLLYG